MVPVPRLDRYNYIVNHHSLRQLEFDLWSRFRQPDLTIDNLLVLGDHLFYLVVSQSLNDLSDCRSHLTTKAIPDSLGKLDTPCTLLIIQKTEFINFYVFRAIYRLTCFQFRQFFPTSFIFLFLPQILSLFKSQSGRLAIKTICIFKFLNKFSDIWWNYLWLPARLLHFNPNIFQNLILFLSTVYWLVRLIELWFLYFIE
jgi:hypothetical protein